MIGNPFKKGKNVRKFGRILSGMTAGLLAATSIIGSNVGNLVSGAEPNKTADGLYDLGTFTYADKDNLGSANSYAVFGKYYFNNNHMEGIFAVKNFYTNGSGFGTTNNVQKFVDLGENYIYFENLVSGALGHMDVKNDNALPGIHEGINNVDSNFKWDMIIPNYVACDYSVNNGNGLQLIDMTTLDPDHPENAEKSGLFNDSQRLANHVYHVSETTYQIDFDEAMDGLRAYSAAAAKVDTEGTATTVSGPNSGVVTITCAEGGNVITLPSGVLENNSLRIVGEDGTTDYSLIINVTDIYDGVHYTNDISVDGASGGYHDEGGKLLLNFGTQSGQIIFGEAKTGVVLAPNADVTVLTSHNGSVFADRVENDTGEIHQNPFKRLPVAGEKKANVEISKKAIGGEDELPGARLTLKNADVQGWDAIVEATMNANEGVEIWTETDNNGNAVGISWISGNEPVTVIGLPDMNGYTLTETSNDGEPVFIAGDDNEYKVIDSSLKFNISDNAVEIVSGPTEYDDVKGYFDTTEADDNKITVSDAEKYHANVELQKNDITGDPLGGAKMKLSAKTENGDDIPLTTAVFPKNYSGNGFELANGAIEWTSSANGGFTFADLPDGVYTYEETSAPSDDYTAPYGTSVSFIVKNGKVYDTDGKEADPVVFEIINEKGNAVKPGDLVVSKKAITGGGEISGAKLTLTNSGISSDDWDTIYKDTVEYNKSPAGKTIFTIEKVVKNNKTVGITWTSDKTQNLIIKGLPKMTSGYTLKEEAANEGELINGKYTVIPSEFKFEINEDGNVEVADDNEAPVKKPANGDGYYGASQNKITVWDAEATNVVISKTDITGETELKGAVLTLSSNNDMSGVTKSADCKFSGDLVRGNDNKSIRWTSDGKNEVKLTGLTNGTYTLTETGADEDGTVKLEKNGVVEEYKVIPSSVTFTVENGTVKNVKMGSKDAATKADATSKEGYALFNSKTNKITVCDAERYSKSDITIGKTDITGETEVVGASLTLTNTSLTPDEWENVTVQLDESKYFGGVTQVRDNNDNVIGVTWYSTDKAAVIKGLLEKGTYTLKEEEADHIGDETQAPDKEIISNGKIYTIIPSEVQFEIKNGKAVVKSTGKAPTKADEKGNGYYKFNDDTITICDAERTDITLNKTDVTGDTEVNGATITITSDDKDIDWTRIKELNANNSRLKWTKNSVSWVSDGKIVEIAGLQNGTYTMTETATDGKKITDAQGNEYDVIDTEYTFNVKNGKVTVTDAKSAFDSTSNEGYVVANDNAVTICDAIRKPENTDVLISKSDVTGEPELKGAKLTIFAEDGKTVVIKEWTSDGKSAKKVSLPDGNYVLRETGGEFTVDGKTYKVIDSDVAFTVKNGTVTAKGAKTTADKDAEESYALFDGKNKITICDAERLPVVLNKTDVTGEDEVEGAKITITSKDGNTNISWTSKIGETKEMYLDDGDYTLKEEAVEGTTIVDENGNEYEVITSTVDFTVTNGKVSSKSGKTEFDANAKEGYIVADGNELTVCDARRPVSGKTDVLIDKTDITGENELKGAKLTIFAEDGKTVVVKQWTSSGRSAKKVSLSDGNYVLRETGGEFTVNGKTYKVIDSDVAFTVKNGKVTVKGAKTTADKDARESYALFDGENKITICDAERIPVVLNKTDITGEKEIKGAKITVKSKDGNTNISWTSKIGETKNMILDDGDYTLTEEAVKGTKVVDADGNEYDVITSSINFTVKDGKVSSKDTKKEFDADAKEGYVVSKDNTITVCDAKRIIPTTDVLISKSDITGEPELAGAELTVFKADGKTVVEQWTSDGKTAKKLSLVDGKYILRETGSDFTVDGKTYTVLTSKVTFTIKNGKITTTGTKKTADENATKSYALFDGTNKITICDAERAEPEKATVIISKTDVTGDAELPGAQLKITNAEADWSKIAAKDGRKLTAVTDNDAAIGYTWVSNGTPVELTGLTDGTYELTEEGSNEDGTVVLDGKKYKVIKSSVQFTVKDGKITSVKSDNADAANKFDANAEESYAHFDGANKITVCNAEAGGPTKVTINKFDITGEEELTGATLTITGVDNDYEDSWTSKVGETWEVDLKNGTYDLTETGDKITDKDGNEYEVIDSSLRFKVEDGKVTIVTPKEEMKTDKGFYDFDEASNIIKVSDAKKADKTKVTLNKTDVTGEEELAGAILTIKDKDGNVVDSWTSEIGKTKTFELENGEYELIETGDKITDKDGNEYEVIDSGLKFKVEDGKVIVTEGKTELDTDKGYYDFDEAKNIIRVSDAKKANKTTVTLNKTDVTGEEELAGAILTIKDKDGKVVDSWTSEIGKTKTFELENGEYELIETGDKITDKDGNEYEVIDSGLKFKVEDGKVIVTEGKTELDTDKGYYDFDEAKNIIRVSDAKKADKTKVTINKTDVTGEEELAGAILTIKDKDGNVVDSWTSEIGKTKTFELENGEYELIETGDKITDKDGNEYEVIDSSLKFKVEDGKVIVTEGKTELDTDKGYYDFDEASNIIRVSDAKKANKTKVTLNKTDVTGEEELAGATLTIKSSDGNTELSWVSVIGETKTFELENGEYELIETGDKITDKDGNEYEVIDSSLKFKVEDGKVTIIEGKTELDTDKGYYDFDEAKNIIRVSDAKKARNIDNDDSERDQDTTNGEDDTSKPDESKTPDNPDESSRNIDHDDSSRPTDDDESSRNIDIDDSSKGGDTVEDSKPEESSEEDSSKATPVKDSSAKDSSDKDSSSKATTTTTTTTAKTTTTATNGNPGTGAKVVINSVEFLAAVTLCLAALSRKKKDDDDEDDR